MSDRPNFSKTIDALESTMTTYWLEMHEKPKASPLTIPQTVKDIKLARCMNPSILWYRYLYNAVGAPWHWWIRNKMPAHELQHILDHLMIDIYVLSVGAVPAGFFEIDFRNHPQYVNLTYFGLVADFIGFSLGPWMLSHAVDYCWTRHGRPQKITINTCSHDHPAALRFYKQIGFRVIRQDVHDAPPKEILRCYANIQQPLLEGALSKNNESIIFEPASFGSLKQR